MITITSKLGTTNHVFVCEKEFIYLEDWILQNKGQEVLDAWRSREGTEEAMTHPDSIALYEEWLEDQGITHTQTEDEA